MWTWHWGLGFAKSTWDTFSVSPWKYVENTNNVYNVIFTDSLRQGIALRRRQGGGCSCSKGFPRFHHSAWGLFPSVLYRCGPEVMQLDASLIPERILPSSVCLQHHMDNPPLFQVPCIYSHVKDALKIKQGMAMGTQAQTGYLSDLSRVEKGEGSKVITAGKIN